jgi:hypothetical protein
MRGGSERQKRAISIFVGLYQVAQFGFGVAVRWVNGPKFPYTSCTFTGELDLADAHLTGMYLSNVYLIGV